MLKKILLPSIFTVLAYGFWLSPDFKEISAGVAIFLFGMLFLENGFQSFTGGTLETLLKKGTDRLWKSLLFGIVSTTIMQSSSLVSVISISFLSAGLLKLASGIGIIFGANLGGTTGAWLVAGFGLKVNISAYAMPMLVFGVILNFQKSKSLRGIGGILGGLGFLFLGIHHMKEGFDAFRTTIDLSQFALGGLAGLLLYTLIGIVATVIMQSSHATMVLIITALAAGQVNYENAVALAIGANIGTTITAIIGALGSNEQGKRLAAAHLIFNLVTGVVGIILINQFLWLVDAVARLTGIPDQDYTLKLSVFHTMFNLAGILLIIPWLDTLIRFLEKIIRPAKVRFDEPKYLDMAAIDFPDTATEAVRKETLHVYDNALEIITQGINLSIPDIRSDQPLKPLIAARRRLMAFDIDDAYERKIKGLYSAIIKFISKASFTWQEEKSGRLHWLRNANLELVAAVKDVKHLRKNLALHLNAGNPYIRQAYDEIRGQLAGVLREIEKIRATPDEEVPVLAFDAMKVMVEKETSLMNRQLARLIGEGKIDAPLGSSLMNDIAYAHDISWSLIEMGRALFASSNQEQTDAEQAVALNDKELTEVLGAS